MAGIWTIQRERTRLSGGAESILAKAARAMSRSEAPIIKLALALPLMQLDQLLWKQSDHISIKKLWERSNCILLI